MATLSSTLASSLTRLAVVPAQRAGERVASTMAAVPSKAPTVRDDVRSATQIPADLVAVSKSGTKASAAALSEEELAQQVHAMQEKLDKLNPALAFVVDKDTGKALIQLTDRATKEVILQFPTEAALQITKALDRFQKVQLVNRTA